MTKFLSNILLFTLFSTNLLGQMTIEPGNQAPYSAESIIQNVFLGNGVELTSINFQGGQGSVGLFDNAINNIGINRGIVLSTGPVRDIPDPACNTLTGGTSGVTVACPNLTNLATLPVGVKLEDIALYEITFIPTSDTLRFRYVFASEEYRDDPVCGTNFQGSVCGVTNDAFGFFISGPNPNGGVYDFENIALIPDPNNQGEFLNIPVTINTVNDGIDPTNGSGSPSCDLRYSQYYNQTNSSNGPIFNGYVDVFIAEAVVVPCQEYTIKIAIGDGKDNQRDSAVFLEEKSFSTGSLNINVNNPGLNGGISEGCLPGNILISLPDATATEIPVEYEVLDDPTLENLAIPDVDYIAPSGDISILPGNTFTSLTLSPIDDNEEEDTEFIYITIRRDVCNVDTLKIPLFDNSLDFVNIPDSVFTCAGSQIQIETSLDSRINLDEPAIFKSASSVKINAPDTIVSSFIEVTDIPQEFLNPRMIAEVCIDTLVHTQLNDLDIFLIAPSGQALELTTDNGNRPSNSTQIDSFVNTCFVISAPSFIHLGNPTEGDMNLNNTTYTGKYRPEGNWGSWLSPIVSNSNGTYELLIRDDNGEFEGELISWSITFNATYEIDYEWFPREGLNCFRCESPTARIEESQYYYVTLSDSYSCSKEDSVWVEVLKQPEQPDLMCEALSPSTVRITWDDVDFANLYEFRFNGRFPWILASQDNVSQRFGYTFETFGDRNEIIIEGLTPEEEIQIILRGLNASAQLAASACLGATDTLVCQSLPCDNSSPVIEDIIIDQPSCDSQGRSSAQVIASDPDQPLVYRIYGDNFTLDNSTGEFLALPQGITFLKVIDSTGCVTLDTIRVDDPPPVEIIREAFQDITCHDANDAFVRLLVNSPSPPNTFEWDNVNSNSNELTNLSEGTYTVTVTDSDGCTNTDQIVITNPEPIQYNYIQIDTINCLATNTGTATLEIVGGRQPYNVTWENILNADTITNQSLGMVQFEIMDSLGCIITDSALVVQRVGFNLDFTVSDLTCFTDTSAVAELSPSAGIAPYSYLWDNGQDTRVSNLLHAGDNIVTITDDDGCVVIETITVDSPPLIEIIPDIVATSCFGGNDGSISISVQGGIGFPYEILWDNNTTNNSRENLREDNYCLTVTDGNDCVAEACFFVPNAPIIDINPIIDDISCIGECDGSIELNPFGGSGDFVYRWEGPGGFVSTETNLQDLCIGNYFLTITENNIPNCSQEFELEIGIGTDIAITIIPTDFISCYDGTDGGLEAIPQGGTPPYTYNWSQNSTIVEDSVAINLPQGLYSVTVTDVDGCTSEGSYELVQPEEIDVAFNNRNVLCFGDMTGETTIEVSGGTGDYLINWSNGASNDSLTNLSANTYTVSITDRNGCEHVASTAILQPQEPIEILLNIQDISCAGGEDGIVRLDVRNAVRPIQYSLDNMNFKFDSTFFMVGTGDQVAYIIDANNCMQSLEFFMPDGPELIVDLGPDTTVFFESSIVLDAQVQNNQGDIFYNWAAGSADVIFSCSECPNPEIVNITSSFSVTLTVRDENGCFGEDFLNITFDDSGNIEVPTAFSPDGNGSNDILHVFGDDNIEISSFKIYNRYGALVYKEINFETNDLSKGWNGNFNGKEAPVDSYVWTVEFLLPSGRTEFRTGQTILIR